MSKEMSKEILKDKVREYENDIALVDLLKILIKNKGLIILTTIIVTAFSIGGALYIRSNRVEKLNQNFILKEYADETGKLTIPNLNIETLLYNDAVIDAFYKNKKLNAYFDKTNTAGDKSYLSKRKVLNNLVHVKINDKSSEITLTTNVKDNEVLSLEMIELYLGILNKQRIFQINRNLGEKELLESKVAEYYKNLEKIKVEINEYTSSIPEAIIKNQSILELVELNRPVLIKKQKAQEKYYEEYYNKLLLLRNIKSGVKQIAKTSSVYVLEEKSKSNMIVAIGLILGLFLGIFAAFMKEFFANVDLKN